MNRWKLKSCPRCSGDLLIELCEYGWYEGCLQCGYEHYLQNIAKLEEQESKTDKQPTSVGR